MTARGAASALRGVVAAVVSVDLVSFPFSLMEARDIGIAHGTLNAFNDVLSRPVGSGVVALIGVAAAVSFARRAGRVLSGLIALVALGLLSTAHAQLFGSPWRHLFYSGLCLGGWLLGLAVTRWRGAPTDESYAHMGSVALLASAYLCAGISKMAFGGPAWLSGYPIQAVIVAQDGLAGRGVLNLYRRFVVETPAVASLLSVLTVGFELGAPLMILGRIPRAVVALGLVAIHANIYLLTPILYWQAMLLLVVFGLSADVPSAEIVQRLAIPTPSDTRRFAAAVVLLGLAAVLAVDHQAHRFAQVRAQGGPGRNVPAAPVAVANADKPMQPAAEAGVDPPAPPPAVSTPPLSRIGPLAVGQTIAGSWQVAALELRGDGFVVRLTRPQGHASLELTCARSVHRSPFDLGAAHIFYSNDVQFDDVKAAGLAVQELLRAAAGRGDVCDVLSAWRMAAF
ncbi:MAG: hypothetical protein E6J75_10755 [Deltaproteobacteria bacterium]|nr:MAG: hypothetical protein E6J75_10755 [Deltaproteobacteria bacterium]